MISRMVVPLQYIGTSPLERSRQKMPPEALMTRRNPAGPAMAPA
jgi:hypothetical protein